MLCISLYCFVNGVHPCLFFLYCTNVTNGASRKLFNDPLFINILSKLIQNPGPGSINLDKFYCTRFFSFWGSILKLGHKWWSPCWLSLSSGPQCRGNKIATRRVLDALVYSCFLQGKKSKENFRCNSCSSSLFLLCYYYLFLKWKLDFKRNTST
jgi:hypothetical protein